MMEIFIQKIMENNLYQFEGDLYLQEDGGPIGLLITGTLARLVMLWWDERFLKKLCSLKIIPELYFRYVDDEGIAVEPIEKGTVYKDGELKKEEVQEEGEEQMDENDDEMEIRTAKVFRQISDDIEPMIQFEEDVVQNHESRKIPVLDLACWVDEEAVIHHIHYRKPMASQQVVANSSAIPGRAKRNILEEEAMRRLRNFSVKEAWRKKAAEMEVFNVDMEVGGYPEGFRASVIQRAIERYDVEKANHEKWMTTDREDGRPIFRSAEERRRKKRKVVR
jgi:hypothetical protein